MQNKIYLVSGILAVCFLHKGVMAETASTIQTINLSVPVVALLDIEDVSPQFTFQAPQNAGDGVTLSASNDIFNVAISSNISAAKLDVKINQDLTPNGLSLILDGATLSGCTGPLILTTNNQTYCNIRTQQTSSSSIMINAIAAQGMPSYGNYSVEVTYTLTDN